MKRLIALGALACLQFGWSQGGESDMFDFEILVDSLYDPMVLDVAPDGRIFMFQRDGVLQVWNPAAGALAPVGQVTVDMDGEGGGLGMALDPLFAQNNRIYLYYSAPDTVAPGSPVEAGSMEVLTRFTLNAVGQLDPASAQVIFFVPDQDNDHSGGDLEFDSQGNLYIGAGDDTFINGDQIDGYAPLDERQTPDGMIHDSQRTAANTQSHRGKILRIKPLEAPNALGKLYDIPPGNLFSDPAQGLPEIYTMGNRNPFRLSLDPVTGYLYWGEPGPNSNVDAPGRGPKGHDEINLAQTAGNYGWPYFIGPNKSYIDYNYETGMSTGLPFDPENPVNESPNNTGARELPPARPAIVWYSYNDPYHWPTFGVAFTNAALAGPLYRFNPAVVDSAKLPMKFDNSLIIFDWGRSFIKAVKMDEAGNVLGVHPIWDGSLVGMKLEFDDQGNFIRAYMPENPIKGPMDVALGPNHNLYVLSWGAWDYPNNTGNGSLVQLKYKSGPEGFANPIAREFGIQPPKYRARFVNHLGGITRVPVPPGAEALRLVDLRGRAVWSTPARGMTTATLPEHLSQGLYQLHWVVP